MMPHMLVDIIISTSRTHLKTWIYNTNKLFNSEFFIYNSVCLQYAITVPLFTWPSRCATVAKPAACSYLNPLPEWVHE